MTSKYTARYRANRERLLAEGPLCHWCRKRKATTADHLIELDRGGTDDMDNLVPACRTCNSARGAQYGNAKRATRTAKRAAATRPRKAVFETPSEPTPSANPQSLPKRPKAAPKGKKGGEKRPALGVAPRLESPRWGHRSWGYAVAAWAERNMGGPLMEWQRYALDGLLEVDDGDQLRHRVGLISVARQNGKSWAMVALIGWWLTEAPALRGQPQTVVLTANTGDIVSKVFNELRPILEERHRGKSYKSYGRQSIEMPDGSQLIARASSESIGHGRSVDLAVIDEVWQVSAEAISAGLLPAQRSRRSPLLAMFSTAGTTKSEAMISWREKGIAQIQTGQPGSIYLAEWSMPPDGNPEDRTLWPLANPAMASEVLPLSLETMELERETYDWGDFCRGSLNMWVAADNPWLRYGSWEALRTDEPAPPPAVIALEASAEDSRFSAVATGKMADGRIMVGVAFIVGSETEAWDQLRAQAAPGTVFAIPASLEIRTPPDIKRRAVTVGYQEINRWTKGVAFDVYNGRLCHRGDVALADHVGRAVAVSHNGEPALSSKRSTGSIALARCMVWAVTLARKPGATSKPAMGFARPR